MINLKHCKFDVLRILARSSRDITWEIYLIFERDSMSIFATSCADYPLMNIEKPKFRKNKKNNSKIYPKMGSGVDFLAFLEIDYLYQLSKLTPAMIVKRPTPFNQ